MDGAVTTAKLYAGKEVITEIKNSKGVIYDTVYDDELGLLVHTGFIDSYRAAYTRIPNDILKKIVEKFDPCLNGKCPH